MTNDERRKTNDAESSSVIRHSSFVDSHCHLDLRQFNADRDAAIARAEAAGVGLMIDPAIDLASCRRVLALAERHSNVYAAVGVHPNDCADFDEDAATQLRDLAQHPRVVAIGEIGLDYYWNRVPIEQQKRALQAQLALAAELGLPVILHSRSANGDESRRCNHDLLAAIAGWAPAARTNRGEDALLGVWHAFSGDLAEAQAAYDLGLALGLGGPVTFQNARLLHALVPQLRTDRLLLETDAPYLPPHPYRGQRNEPAHIPLIATALARLCARTLDEIAGATTATARRCFTRLATSQ